MLILTISVFLIAMRKLFITFLTLVLVACSSGDSEEEVLLKIQLLPEEHLQPQHQQQPLYLLKNLGMLMSMG